MTEWFMSLQVGEKIAFFSLIANVLGGIFAFFAFGALRRSHDKRKAIEAEALHQKQRQLEEIASLRTRVDGELISWGVRSIERLAEGHILLQTRGSGSSVEELSKQRDQIQAAISALVDRGRLYFPNHSADIDWPSWRGRPTANKGFRDPILDALMIAHEELRRIDLINGESFTPAASNVFSARKAFISELQDWIRPRKLGFGTSGEAESKINHAAKTWASVEEIVDDFEARYGTRTFWAERPIARAQLLAELAASNARAMA
ncbi:MAG: hypothetical protein ABL871_18645 [Terricaulis sp.]